MIPLPSVPLLHNIVPHQKLTKRHDGSDDSLTFFFLLIFFQINTQHRCNKPQLILSEVWQNRLCTIYKDERKDFFVSQFMRRTKSEWPDAIILRNEDWKFLHDRRSREWRNLKFPMSQERYIQISPCWHSRHGETLFPHKRRSRAWGNNVLP